MFCIISSGPVLRRHLARFYSAVDTYCCVGSSHQEWQAAQDQDRCPHHTASRLCRQPAHPQADRGGLRLDQGHWRPGQDQVPGAADRAIVHAGPGGVQPHAIAEAPGTRTAMTRADSVQPTINPPQTAVKPREIRKQTTKSRSKHRNPIRTVTLVTFSTAC